MNALAEFVKRWPFNRAHVIVGVSCAVVFVALVAWLGLPAWSLLVVALPVGGWGVYVLVQRARAKKATDQLRASIGEQRGDTARVAKLGAEARAPHFGGEA